MPTSSITAPDGASIAVHTTGGSPPEVLLVHGWMASSGVWDRLLPHLDGVVVARVDLRGSGASTRGAAPMSLALLADDLCRVVDALPRVHLVGHSMGGALAQLVAARRPGRLRSLALVNAVPVAGLPLPEPVVAWFSNAGGDADALGRVLDAACKELAPADRAALLASALAIAPETVRATFEAWSAGTTEDLSGVDCPTLVVATDDPFLPPALLQAAVADRIPGARLAHLPGPGHYPQLERPAETAALLRRHWVA